MITKLIGMKKENQRRVKNIVGKKVENNCSLEVDETNIIFNILHSVFSFIYILIIFSL